LRADLLAAIFAIDDGHGSISLHLSRHSLDSAWLWGQGSHLRPARATVNRAPRAQQESKRRGAETCSFACFEAHFCCRRLSHLIPVLLMLGRAVPMAAVAA